MKWAIARANALGVIVVGPAGNDNEEETIHTYGKWSGVVSVSAIDTAGKRAEYSSWGKGVTVAAVGGPIVAHNYATGTNINANGTSNATPLVAGFLALAKQKWPNATSNQLLQLLTHTAPNRSKRVEQVHRIRRSRPRSHGQHRSVPVPRREPRSVGTKGSSRMGPANGRTPTQRGSKGNPSNTSPASSTPETSPETPPTPTAASTKAS